MTQLSVTTSIRQTSYRLVLTNEKEHQPLLLAFLKIARHHSREEYNLFAFETRGETLAFVGESQMFLITR